MKSMLSEVDFSNVKLENGDKTKLLTGGKQAAVELIRRHNDNLVKALVAALAVIDAWQSIDDAEGHEAIMDAGEVYVRASTHLTTALEPFKVATAAETALAAKDAQIANRPFTAEQLKDPGIVLANMQHGTIATPQRFIDEQAYSNGLQDEIDRLTALNTAKGELIEFYTNYLSGISGYLAMHQMSPSEAQVEYGNRLRARIRSLENE